MSKELQKTLLDVRKAYRLMYLYQKHVLSTIERFVQEFSDAIFYWWSPVYYYPPPMRSTNLTKRWTWDLIPFFLTSIFYRYSGGDPDNHPKGDWLLEFTLITDSAADECFEEASNEPSPLDFASPEEAETNLLVAMWFCKDDAKFNWFKQWESLEYPEDDFCEYDFPKGLICVTKEYSLDELENENRIVNSTKNFKKILSKYIPQGNW